MSDALKIMLENISLLSTKEKAFAAHCLLTAMNTESDESVDTDWLKLAESRSSELESGEVKGITWDEIKNEILS